MEAVYPMNRCLRAVLVITALACSSISCQGTVEGLSSVGGKVLCNGEPAAGAVLVFHRRDGASSLTSNTSQVIPTAVVQDDGTFAVQKCATWLRCLARHLCRSRSVASRHRCRTTDEHWDKGSNDVRAG